MSLGPSFDKAVAHHRAGELDQAVTLYRHVLRTARGEEAARAWQLLASALHQQGQVDQAEEALRTAIRAEPAPALGGRAALAMLLSAQARMNEAVEVWRAAQAPAKAAGPRAEGEARLRLIHQLAEARRIDEAIAEAEKLAADLPRSPAAQYELGRLLERVGRRGEARAALERAMSLQPESPEAHLLMARVESAEGKREEARARLEKLVETLPDQRRGVAMIELASVFDKLGVHELAFEMARRGQQVNFAGLPASMRDGSLHERVIESCLRITKEEVERWGAPESTMPPGEAPIFIVGFPRSGTTLLEQMLAAHPRLAVSDELPILQRTREKLYLTFKPKGWFPDDLGAFTDEQIEKARRWYMDRAAQAMGGVGARLQGRRLVDKQPLNTMDLCFIRRVFPESPVVFVSRDPRDTVLSCFMQGFARGVPHLFTLEGTARLYDRLMTLWSHYKQVLGQRFIEVRYEDLAREPEAQARRVLEFLGEPWDEAVLRSHEAPHRRYVTTPSYADVAQPVHTRAIGRWEKYKVQLEPVMRVLGKWVG